VLDRRAKDGREHSAVRMVIARSFYRLTAQAIPGVRPCGISASL
jgi:hypothetical protein